jgi:serine protease Do
MASKSQKILKISVVTLVIIFLISILGVFFLIKDSLTKRVGDVLSKFSPEEPSSDKSILVQPDSSTMEIDELVSQVGDSVVAIGLKENHEEGNRNSIGSGIILDPGGLILTSTNVISSIGSKYVVILQNSNAFPVLEVQKDLETGLVFVKIQAQGLKAFVISNQEEPKLGQKIIGIDNSIGLSNSISTGIVSGIKKDLKFNTPQLSNLIQTDLKTSQGSLGGPVIDYNGNLLGVLFKPVGENVEMVIPNEEIKKALGRYLAKSLQKEGTAFLGIGYRFKNLKDYLNKGEPIGPVIDGVVKDSPASESGIEIGDIIVNIDGREFGDEEELTQFIKTQKPGNKIEIRIFRKGNLIDISVVFAQKN